MGVGYSRGAQWGWGTVGGGGLNPGEGLTNQKEYFSSLFAIQFQYSVCGVSVALLVRLLYALRDKLTY